MTNPEATEATAGSQKRVAVYGWVERTIEERCLKSSAVVNASVKVAARNPDLLGKALCRFEWILTSAHMTRNAIVAS